MRQITLALSSLYADEGFAGRQAGSFPDSHPGDAGVPAGPQSFDAFVDLTDLEGASLYCSDETASAVRGVISGLPARAIHLIDTGDYHYLSLFWLEKIDEPFALVLFDNHPDDQPTAFGQDTLSCGSWVAAARSSLPLMKRDMWLRSAADIDALLGNRLADQDGRPCQEGDLETLAALPIYLSVDLDVLSPSEFSTDWNQGDMTFDELCFAIASIAARHRIAGIDICGGLTEAKGATGAQLTRNAALREALLSFLGALL